MDKNKTLECVTCGDIIHPRLGDNYMRVYVCDWCGRVYDTSNYTVDEWADMFDLDPRTVADEWGIEYAPDSDTDSATDTKTLIEQARELHYSLVNRYWELRDTKGKTKQARRAQKLAQKAMRRWLRRIKANNA